MKEGYWRVQFVERRPHSEKEFALRDVLTVSYLKAVSIGDEEAFKHLVNLIKKAVE